MSKLVYDHATINANTTNAGFYISTVHERYRSIDLQDANTKDAHDLEPLFPGLTKTSKYGHGQD